MQWVVLTGKIPYDRIYTINYILIKIAFYGWYNWAVVQYAKLLPDLVICFQVRRILLQHLGYELISWLSTVFQLRQFLTPFAVQTGRARPVCATSNESFHNERSSETNQLHWRGPEKPKLLVRARQKPDTDEHHSNTPPSLGQRG